MGGGAFIRVCRASIPVRNSRAKIFLIKGTGSSNYAELKETKHCVRRRGGETSFSMYLQAAAPMFTGPRSKREPHATTQPPCTPQPRPDSRRGPITVPITAPSRSLEDHQLRYHLYHGKAFKFKRRVGNICMSIRSVRRCGGDREWLALCVIHNGLYS